MMTMTNRRRFTIAALIYIALVAACGSALAGVHAEINDAATRIKNSRNVRMASTGAKGAAAYPHESFRTPGQGELEAARSALSNSLAKVFADLEEIPVGASIKRELALDKLAKQLASGRPDLGALSNILDGLSGKVYRPGVPKFDGLRDMLKRYLALCRLIHGKKLRVVYKHKLAELDTALADSARPRSADELRRIAEVYAWLTANLQAPQTRSWLEERFARPNFLAVMSPDMLAGQVEQELRQDMEINETRQGIRTTGSGTAIGNMTFELVPNADIGQFRVVFEGGVTSKLQSRRKRVRINGRMRAKVSVSQDLFAAGELTRAPSADVDVTCDYRPCNATVCVRAKMIRRMGSRLALRFVRRKKHEVDSMGERYIEQSLAKEIAKIADKELEQHNRNLDEFVFAPLRSRDIGSNITTRTSETQFEVMGTFLAAGQLAAPRSVPAVDSDSPCTVWMHESMLNNLSVLLEGEELEEHVFRETLFESFGLVPEESEEHDPSRISATIRFAHHDPLAVRLVDGKIRLRVRLDAFANELGWQKGGPWEARTAYTVSNGGGSIQLRRCEPIELRPSDSPQDRQMKDILARMLVESATSAGITISGQVLDGLKVKLSSARVIEGWACVMLDSIPAEPSSKRAPTIPVSQSSPLKDQ